MWVHFRSTASSSLPATPIRPTSAAAVRKRRTLIEYASAGITDPGLAELARAFHGPLPYLTVMASVTGIRDPFDRRLVEAYWVGNPILDRVDVGAFARVLDEGFRRRMGGGWGFFEETIPAGGVPHHSFHVLAVYPWVGLLRTERAEPIEILERCRIRWGTVVAVTGESAVVTSQPLRWDRPSFFGLASRRSTWAPTASAWRGGVARRRGGDARTGSVTASTRRASGTSAITRCVTSTW
jgi:hypothetical protein